MKSHAAKRNYKKKSIHETNNTKCTLAMKLYASQDA